MLDHILLDVENFILSPYIGHFYWCVNLENLSNLIMFEAEVAASLFSYKIAGQFISREISLEFLNIF